MPSPHDIPDFCLCCGEEIDVDNGVSLSGDLQAHVCSDCWKAIPPLEKLKLTSTWRRDRAAENACDALARSLSGIVEINPFGRYSDN